MAFNFMVPDSVSSWLINILIPYADWHSVYKEYSMMAMQWSSSDFLIGNSSWSYIYISVYEAVT